MVLLLLPPNFIRWCSDKYIKNKRFHKSPRVIVLVRFIIISNTWLNKLMLLLIVQWISQTTNTVIGAALGLLVLKPAGKEAIIHILRLRKNIQSALCLCSPISCLQNGNAISEESACHFTCRVTATFTAVSVR